MRECVNVLMRKCVNVLMRECLNALMYECINVKLCYLPFPYVEFFAFDIILVTSFASFVSLSNSFLSLDKFVSSISSSQFFSPLF